MPSATSNVVSHCSSITCGGKPPPYQPVKNGLYDGNVGTMSIRCSSVGEVLHAAGFVVARGHAHLLHHHAFRLAHKLTEIGLPGRELVCRSPPSVRSTRAVSRGASNPLRTVTASYHGNSRIMISIPSPWTGQAALCWCQRAWLGGQPPLVVRYRSR